MAPQRVLGLWRILPFLWASLNTADTGLEDSSGNAYGFHHGGTG